jgi:hypothetical protein
MSPLCHNLTRIGANVAAAGKDDFGRAVGGRWWRKQNRHAGECLHARWAAGMRAKHPNQLGHFYHRTGLHIRFEQVYAP